MYAFQTQNRQNTSSVGHQHSYPGFWISRSCVAFKGAVTVTSSSPCTPLLILCRPLGLLHVVGGRSASFAPVTSPFSGPGCLTAALRPVSAGLFPFLAWRRLTGLAAYWPAWARAHTLGPVGWGRLFSAHFPTDRSLLAARWLGRLLPRPASPTGREVTRRDAGPAFQSAASPLRLGPMPVPGILAGHLLSARQRPGRPGAGRVVPSGWSRLCCDCGLARSVS